MLWLLFVTIIVDLVVCSLYCRRRKRKTLFNEDYIKAFPDNISPVSEMGGRQTTMRDNSRTQLLKKLCHQWIESLLRLTLWLVSYFPSHHVRNWVYRHVFKVTMGRSAVIYYGAEIRAPWNLYIGKGSIIGDKAILDARSGIWIGENVNFSTGVWIWTLQHDVQDRNFGTYGEGKPVIIHDRAWLSARSVILPGVKVAEGSVAAAGTVLTKSTEAFAIYGGVPGKKIGIRNPNIDYEFDGNHMHFL